MEVVNYKDLIEQNFKNEKQVKFKIKDKEFFVTVKKIDFLTRKKIEKYKIMGIVNKYEYDYKDGESYLKNAETYFTEESVQYEEKIIDMLLDAVDTEKHNLKNGKINKQDLYEIGKYNANILQHIIDEVLEFNGLKKT